jgi:D-glycero-D-manno-heptose 1,7-bisphosphate phosphatase
VKRLFIFDLDGTLVEDHLIDRKCERCGGSGEVYDPGNPIFHPPRAPGHRKCDVCNGRGSQLVPREDRAYVEPALLPRVGSLIRDLALPSLGNSFAIATNQGGVALGFQTEEEVRLRIRRSLDLLVNFNWQPYSVHVATAYPGHGDPTPHELHLRKPAPGMLIEAMVKHGTMPGDTVFVGDRDSDRAAAEAAGVEFVDAAKWLEGSVDLGA